MKYRPTTNKIYIKLFTVIAMLYASKMFLFYYDDRYRCVEDNRNLILLSNK